MISIWAGMSVLMSGLVSVQPISTLGEPRESRLASLAPERPEGYFELAEEVADEVRSPEDLALARTLYVLAFELSRREGASSPLAASACLGLAHLERLRSDRRWLVALASTQDPRYATQDWNVEAGSASSTEVALRAATALGLARTGESRQAQDLLSKPGVMPLLQEYERAIGTTGLAGALSRLEKHLKSWPCPECQNRRILSRQTDAGLEHRLCGTCGGNPGPALSNDELVGQLAFEAVLLKGIQRSWAAQIAVDQGVPLRDPDPAELAPTYRVDPTKPYWRDGRWVEAARAGGGDASAPAPASSVPAVRDKQIEPK